MESYVLTNSRVNSAAVDDRVPELPVGPVWVALEVDALEEREELLLVEYEVILGLALPLVRVLHQLLVLPQVPNLLNHLIPVDTQESNVILVYFFFSFYLLHVF